MTMIKAMPRSERRGAKAERRKPNAESRTPKAEWRKPKGSGRARGVIAAAGRWNEAWGIFIAVKR
jgi:hypothetical protein